jgi:ATP dependent DNA ligase-like protein
MAQKLFHSRLSFQTWTLGGTKKIVSKSETKKNYAPVGDNWSNHNLTGDGLLSSIGQTSKEFIAAKSTYGTSDLNNQKERNAYDFDFMYDSTFLIRREEFVVGGYTAGNPFDALIVGCYDGARLNFVAKVRNGFVPHVRREVFHRLKGLVTEKCPFDNLPEKRRTQWALTSDEMKECHWLKPRLVAQIEFTEWTPDEHLRHSSFVALRDDKEARQIRRE